MSKFIEYRVRPVTRYVVTRYTREEMGKGGGPFVAGCETVAEFDNERMAQDVVHSLICTRPENALDSQAYYEAIE